ncbi:MAG: hypothetical protein CM15mP93_05620 [Thiotrichaceae bacterium]|nr:MAG: hypothetical protein CM15mP93_05620 [Thiotrichaceae bacterium]
MLLDNIKTHERRFKDVGFSDSCLWHRSYNFVSWIVRKVRLINLIEKLSLYPQIVIRDNPEIFDTYKTSNIHNHGRYNFFVSNLLQINDCLTKINTNKRTVSFDKVGENQLVRENNKLKNELLALIHGEKDLLKY